MLLISAHSCVVAVASAFRRTKRSSERHIGAHLSHQIQKGAPLREAILALWRPSRGAERASLMPLRTCGTSRSSLPPDLDRRRGERWLLLGASRRIYPRLLEARIMACLRPPGAQNSKLRLFFIFESTREAVPPSPRASAERTRASQSEGPGQEIARGERPEVAFFLIWARE